MIMSNEGIQHEGQGDMVGKIEKGIADFEHAHPETHEVYYLNKIITLRSLPQSTA